MTTNTDSSRKFSCVADALGLGTLADGEPGMDPELLRDLYRHARGEDGERVLFQGNPTFTKGWVNLASPRAQRLVSAFVALDDADTLKNARYIAQTNLEAQAWNDVLGIEDPPIICKVKIHGTQWGLRFQAAGPVLRGREVLNEDLPPLVEAQAGREDTEPRDTEALADSDSPINRQEGVMNGSAAADTLRRGGMPI